MVLKPKVLWYSTVQLVTASSCSANTPSCRNLLSVYVLLPTYLPRSALRPIERRALLGLAEVRVIWMAAPQLLTGVECAKLEQRKHRGDGADTGTCEKSAPLLASCCMTAEMDLQTDLSYSHLQPFKNINIRRCTWN